MVPIPLFRPDDFEPPVVGASGGTTPKERARNLAYEAGERVDRIMLACEAMWSLFREKLGLSRRPGRQMNEQPGSLRRKTRRKNAENGRVLPEVRADHLAPIAEVPLP